MRSKRILLVTVAGALLLSMLACKKEGQNGQEEVVKIGTILGLTGENSAYGVRMLKGLELALEQVNAASVGDRRFELVVEDSQWEPRLGVNAYRKMHDLEGIRHFAAICGSKIALAVAEASRDDDIVIVDAISGAPRLTTRAGPKYFRVYASDALAGESNLAWALAEGAKTFGVVYVEDDWGASYKDAILNALQARDLIATSIPITLGSQDFRSEARKILNQKPDALFVVLYANLALPLVRELRTLGFSGLVYGGDNLSSSDFYEAGQEVIDGIRLSLPAEPDSESYRQFAAKYRTKFDEDPDSFALKSFDALMLLADAIQSTDGAPESVVRYLRETPGYVGASGVLSFDINGDLNHQEYEKMVYQDAHLVPFISSHESR